MDVEVLCVLVEIPGYVQNLELAGVALHGKMEQACQVS